MRLRLSIRTSSFRSTASYAAALAICAVAVGWMPLAGAQQGSPPAAAGVGATDAEPGKAILIRMADFLAKGQAVLRHRRVRLRSPVRIRAEDRIRPDPPHCRRSPGQSAHRDRAARRLEAARAVRWQAHDDVLPRENVFGSLERPGTIDQMLYHLVQDLQTPVPLSLLLATSLPQEMEKRVTEVTLVERETLAGKPVDHIAARTNDVDFQAWIAQGDGPVPLRVVLTYKNSSRTRMRTVSRSSGPICATGTLIP